ncbi:hypothetical protein [Kocuria rosea]|uniref:Uncharacterized protein n=1 Tax=Kocuria rosea TaxID=1275 RepID=A0A4V6PNF6_KOCRO|nr:hypothetical protein [Kocuria rosea]TDL42449.1 hypothetical protein E2R59_10915 [Kocuria rosea]
MSTSPDNPDNPGHPYEPARGGLPRYAPPGGYDRARDGHGQQHDPAPAPPQLTRLLGLTVASGALYAALGVVVTIIYSTMDFATMYQRMGVPAEDAGQIGTMVEQMRGISMASGVIGLVVLVGLYVMEYVFLSKGANWARILGIVLAILSAVGFLGNLFGFWLYGQWAIVLITIGIAFIAVNIAWLVTAFRAPLRDWFATQRYTR